LKVLHEGISLMKSKGMAVDSIQPMGALYLTIKLDYTGTTAPDGTVIKDASDLVFYLIREGIALVPFSAFGGEKSSPWFRASVGGLSLDEIRNCLPKLEAALGVLK